MEWRYDFYKNDAAGYTPKWGVVTPHFGVYSMLCVSIVVVSQYPSY